MVLLVVVPASLVAEEKKSDDGIRIDVSKRTVRIPAVVVKQGRYPVLKGAIEYVLVSDGGKDYEALFRTSVTPVALHAALLKVGLRAGSPASDEKQPSGLSVRIHVEYELEDAKAKKARVRRAVDELIVSKKSGKPLKPMPWLFTGSKQVFDPELDKDVLQCVVTKNIIGLHYNDASPLFQNGRVEARRENSYKANLKELPAADTRVELSFEVQEVKVAAGTKRVHVFVTGRVQGVGYRNYTQREARRLKLGGWVRNLPDGRVEATVEGPGSAVEKLLKKLKRGPRAARVEKVSSKEEKAEGVREFMIRF